MKLLGISFFFLAVLCVCTVGANYTIITTNSTTGFTLTSPSVMEAGNASTSQKTTLQTLTSTTTIRVVNQSITSNHTTSSPTATYKTTQGSTTQLPVETSTAAADKNDSTTNTTQTNRTQLTHTESLNASSTKESSFYSTTSLQNTTAHRSSGHHVNSTTESTEPPFGSAGSSSGNTKVSGSDIHYSSVILPIVITLIVITLSAFSLVALYRMCQKKTPERQENSTERAQSDKEGVKLLSVKTTSPETGSRWMPLGPGEEVRSLVFVEVRDIYEVGFSLPSANLSEPTSPPPSGEVSQGRTTGEHSSQGRNKTRQLFAPQQ